MSRRKVPSDPEFRALWKEHPTRTIDDWAHIWGCSKSAVDFHRQRLGLPSLRERRAFNAGERAWA